MFIKLLYGKELQAYREASAQIPILTKKAQQIALAARAVAITLKILKEK